MKSDTIRQSIFFLWLLLATANTMSGAEAGNNELTSKEIGQEIDNMGNLANGTDQDVDRLLGELNVSRQYELKNAVADIRKCGEKSAEGLKLLTDPVLDECFRTRSELQAQLRIFKILASNPQYKRYFEDWAGKNEENPDEWTKKLAYQFRAILAQVALTGLARRGNSDAINIISNQRRKGFLAAGGGVASAAQRRKGFLAAGGGVASAALTFFLFRRALARFKTWRRLRALQNKKRLTAEEFQLMKKLQNAGAGLRALLYGSGGLLGAALTAYLGWEAYRRVKNFHHSNHY